MKKKKKLSKNKALFKLKKAKKGSKSKERTFPLPTEVIDKW